ncbi:hypothetical protein CERSUDRAFT_114164 [Gelatoporia subvermispora B]|uniref:Uncharacterized protein n=1 Tax=Ceriporiopsis subvermispora (strain B) TaxID=914234 RepID=M2PMC6_CERS8|nr:hypothetical protein CERSUDRAFT_114164 [Gelatoporia subvermispora B]
MMLLENFQLECNLHTERRLKNIAIDVALLSKPITYKAQKSMHRLAMHALKTHVWTSLTTSVPGTKIFSGSENKTNQIRMLGQEPTSLFLSRRGTSMRCEA